MSDDAPARPSPDPFLLWFDWTLRLLWWALQVAWRWIWWSESAHVLVAAFWLASCIDLVLKRSALSLRIFEYTSIALLLILVVPFVWGAYRLYTRVRQPAVAGWQRAGSEVAQQLRSDWIAEIKDLGFSFSGYLCTHQKDMPSIALLVNSEKRDSAHVSRVAGKEFFVFKTRFANGFAFETGNTTTARLLPTNPRNPTFRFPSIRIPGDLYRVHLRIRNGFEAEQEPVISDSEGEIAEFISRAEVVRSYMMSRDYRLKASDSVYVFTACGAMRHAVLLTWPIKPIREWLFRRKVSTELEKLGFRLDRASRRLLDQ